MACSSYPIKFPCDLCGTGFASYSHRWKHVRQHFMAYDRRSGFAITQAGFAALALAKHLAECRTCGAYDIDFDDLPIAAAHYYSFRSCPDAMGLIGGLRRELDLAVGVVERC